MTQPSPPTRLIIADDGSLPHPGQKITDLAGLEALSPGSIEEAWLGNAAAALCTSPEAATAFWRALWRAMAQGGRVELRLSPDAPATPGGAALREAAAAGALHHMPLSLEEARALCERIWCLDMTAPAPFGVAQGLSFAIAAYTPSFHTESHTAIKRGKSSQATLLIRSQARAGVVAEHAFTLLANKAISPFEEVTL